MIVNEDAEILKEAHREMLAKQLDENTIKECMARYTAHIYFHLFKTYEYSQAAKKQHQEEDRSTSRLKPNYEGKSTAGELH